MKIIQRILNRRLPVPHPDVYWSEISSAIGAAVITIRDGEDLKVIVNLSVFGSIQYSSSEAKRALKIAFPDISDSHLTRAVNYLHNRVVDKRQWGDQNFMRRHSGRKNRATQW